MKETVEQKYQQKDPRQHVLDRPHNYIGNMSFTDPELMFLLNSESLKMELKKVSYVPAFLKIFDEILSNSLDHFAREKTVDRINVNINRESGLIEVFNNGPGVEVELHKEKNIYIPELIFGNLFTSSNYDDTKERDWVGTNGLGSKAVSIFSKKFIVETVDSKNEKKYIQEFSENMSKIDKPVITKSKLKPYTKISFIPDFKRFGMKSIDKDTFKVLEKRVYDVSAGISKTRKLNLTFNDTKINSSSFIDYVNLFPIENEKYHAILSNKWEVVIAKNSDDEFKQISFVNGVPTIRGGRHVDNIVSSITKRGSEIIKSKNKDLVFKTANIKEKLIIFVLSKVKNPKFDSQTKEYLVTSAKDLGNLEIPDKIIKPFIKDIVDEIISMANVKNQNKLNKEVSSRNKKNLRVPKLDDANLAGTNKGYLCSLVLTEGDSAKTGVSTGILPKSKDYIGVFPLKGKILNVQEATQKQLETNEEIKNMMMILGLQKGVKYDKDSVLKLRYGKVYIVTDQDFDGFHICSLALNFFKTWFPELLKLNFVKTVKTPIVRVEVKGNKKEPLFFYTLSSFDNWKENNKNTKFEVFYKKGLGSLTDKESKIFFSDLSKTEFEFINDKNGFENIDLAFSKKNIEKRKEWLSVYDKNITLDYTKNEATISDYIHKQLKHFSSYDNVRSIPNICDGLKPSQRKVLYGCLKKKITTPVKVSQLSGYISEHSEYHHGEASLQSTIISMAQNFMGSNNINLLFPENQFGSRIKNGKDASSPRYISTRLSEITKFLFPEPDSSLLEYTKGDEGNYVEPDFYSPIIPMILINGSRGIGTGYSTNIPMYNPQDIIDYLKNILNKKENKEELIPWYRGFKGTIVKQKKDKYITNGVYEFKSPNKIIIRELPIGIEIENYKDFLDSLVESGFLKSFNTYGTPKIIHYELIFKDENLLKKLLNNGNVLDQLNLQSNIATSNMVLFTPEGTIKKYSSPEKIISDYFPYRLKLYKKRKLNQIKNFESEIRKISNRIKFIEYIIDNKIKVFRVKKNIVIEKLEKLEFDKENDSFEYLLKMSVDSFTEEEIKKLNNKRDNLTLEMNKLEKKTPEIIWLEELDNLEIIWREELKVFEKYEPEK